MKKGVIITAGGKGLRMGLDKPKQFVLIEKKPLLFYTLEAFWNYDPHLKIVLVLPKEHIQYWNEIKENYTLTVEHEITVGGETRYHSVKNGLKKLQECDIIAIHDAVRPLVNKEFLSKLFDTAAEKGSAVPVLQATETIRKINKEQSKVLNRSEIFSVQTPQIFFKDWINVAYNLPYNETITDDAMLVEQAGYHITYVPGLKYNIKLTTPEDLFIIECIIKNLQS